MALIWSAIRIGWLVTVGWVIGLLLFAVGAAISVTIVGAPIGYKMMNSAYNFATLNFE